MVSAGFLVAALVWSLTFSSCASQRIAWLVPGSNSTNLINSDKSIAALKLALASVSRTSLTPDGKNFSVKIFETECSTKAAMIAMIKQRSYDPDVIIGPPCKEGMRTVAKVAAYFNVPVFSWFNPSTEFDDSKKYPTLIRMFPSVGLMRKALFHIMKQNGWKRFALLHDADSLGRILKDDLRKEVARTKGYRITSTSRISNNMTDAMLEMKLNKIKKRSTIIVLACSGNSVRRYMLAANKAGMTSGQYVFIQLDYKIYTAGELRREVLSDKAWRRGDSKDEIARLAYESLIHVILDPTYDLHPRFTRVTPKSTYGQFSRLAIADVNMTKPGWELPEVKSLSDVKPCVSSLFLYDSLLVWSVLTEVLNQTGMDPRSGRTMARIAKNFNSEGSTGYITFSQNLERLGKVFVLDMNRRGKFKPVQVLKENKASTFDVNDLTPADTMFTWSLGRRGIPYRPQDVPQITKQYMFIEPTTPSSTTTPKPTTTITTTKATTTTTTTTPKPTSTTSTPKPTTTTTTTTTPKPTTTTTTTTTPKPTTTITATTPKPTTTTTTTKPTTTTTTTTPTPTTTSTTTPKPTTTTTKPTTTTSTTTPTPTTTTTTTPKPTTTTTKPTTTTTTTTLKPTTTTTTTPKPTTTTTPKPTTTTTTTSKPTTTPTTTTEKIINKPYTRTTSTGSHNSYRNKRKQFKHEEDVESIPSGRRNVLGDLESLLANLIKKKVFQAPNDIFHGNNRGDNDALKLDETQTPPFHKMKTSKPLSTGSTGKKRKQRVSKTMKINRPMNINNRDQQEQSLQRRDNIPLHRIRKTESVLSRGIAMMKAGNKDARLLQYSQKTTSNNEQTAAIMRNTDLVDNTRGTQGQTGIINPASKKHNTAVRNPVDKLSVNIAQFPNDLNRNFGKSLIDTTMVYPKNLFPSDALDPASLPTLAEYTPPVENPYTFESKTADSFNAIPKQWLEAKQRVENLPYLPLRRERIRSIVPINSDPYSNDAMVWQDVPSTTTVQPTTTSTIYTTTKPTTTTQPTTTTKPTTTTQPTTTITRTTTTTRKPVTVKHRKKSTVPKGKETILEKKVPSAIELIMARLMQLEAYIKASLKTTTPTPPAVTARVEYSKRLEQAPFQIPVTREYKKDPSQAIYERLLAIESSIENPAQKQKPYLNTIKPDPTIISKQVKEKKHRPNRRIKELPLPTNQMSKYSRIRQGMDNRKVHTSNTQNGVIWGSRIISQKMQDGQHVEEDTSDRHVNWRETSQNAIKQSQLVIQTQPTTIPTPVTTIVSTTPPYTQSYVNNIDTLNKAPSAGRRQQIVNVNKKSWMPPLAKLKSKAKSHRKTRNNPALVVDNSNITVVNKHTSYITDNQQIPKSEKQELNVPITAVYATPPTRAGNQTVKSVNETMIERLSAKVAESVTNQIAKEVVAASLGSQNDSKYAIHIVSNWIPSNVEEGLPKLKMTFHVNKTKSSNQTADVNAGSNKPNVDSQQINKTNTSNVSNQIQIMSSQNTTANHIEEDGNQKSPNVKSKTKGKGLKISLATLLSSMGFKLPQRPMSGMNGMRPPGRMQRPGPMPPMQQMQQMPNMQQMPQMPRGMPPMPNMPSSGGMRPMPMMHPAYSMMQQPRGGGGGEAEEGQQQPSYGPPPMYGQPPPMYGRPMPQGPPMYPPNARYGPPPPSAWQARGGKGFPPYQMPPMYGGRPMWPGSQRRRSRVAD